MRVAWLKDLRLKDLPQVGGKNASLGEMIGGLSSAGIRVPGGFATTADAYREFVAQGGLDKKIEQRLATLDPKDVRALAACGSEIRSWIAKSPFPADFENEIRSYFQQLEKQTSSETSFAVRSSATAEDLPDVGNNDIHYFLVGKRRGNRQMCILREVMPPGTDTGDTMLSHDGEEGGVIVQGQVEITVGERVKVLGPGEAYYFESRTPHRFRNVGNDDAIIVSANTPATF